MSERLARQAFYELGPRITSSLLALGKTDQQSTLEKRLCTLVRLRVSQINACCFCLHMHSQELREVGEQQARLDVLSAWREANCFSGRERSALALAESITRIAEGGVTDEIYQQCLREFGERDLLELMAVILEINSWNRVSVSLGFQPDIR
ncbi:carboxymuconolactone decarboxylase family protein [Microbulbifer halophilus]|uniref:Carboxymuconolactone decarboxylase family protein n=1 Tax=Microbulbifer halophilus TaxID=453963 RepID=A0ABW5EFL4_9GAMM|nr:carboxymuconolactone decarboxylase family protein [Microbulbifer halophilus]MCW8126193.1 carboxymuconolactone decarboxylase family protein [Microbulbifer halophilus]